MKNNQDLIKKYFTAFSKRDFKTMQQCYHTDACFSDPVFANLNYKQIKAMWHMLCENGSDLKIGFHITDSYDNIVKANWNAAYTFSKTGNVVANIVHSKFLLKEELIIEQTDSFDLWRWSRMALGIHGVMFGWTNFLEHKIQTNANNQLKRFIEKHANYSYTKKKGSK